MSVSNEKEHVFNHWAFEKADTEDDTIYFDELKAKGFENQMKYHRKMTSCWDWTNYDAWVDKTESVKFEKIEPVKFFETNEHKRLVEELKELEADKEKNDDRIQEIIELLVAVETEYEIEYETDYETEYES